MKNESQFKNHFKKSVRAQKGFSLSLAAPLISGLPDLYVIMPGYVPLLLEAKWFGEIFTANFHRKIPYTSLQLHWLKECCRVKDYTALGLIGYKYNTKYWCSLVHPSYTHFNSLCADNYHTCISNMKELFDVNTLFSYYSIPRITNGVHENATISSPGVL